MRWILKIGPVLAASGPGTAGSAVLMIAGMGLAAVLQPLAAQSFSAGDPFQESVPAGAATGTTLDLSLDDAIALALENNLDIELERFTPKIADTDLLRSQGGGLPRGLSLLVNEPAPGIGGPNGPLLTSLTSGSTPTPIVSREATPPLRSTLHKSPAYTKTM